MDKKPVELDGTTGEGGGQLVRNAISLASVISQPIRIVNVRGNRQYGKGRKGGGLKAQHVAAIQVLADATAADVVGLQVGSPMLEFRPRRGPGADAIAALLAAPSADASTSGRRLIRIAAGTAAASAMCIFQCVFPFLLFAGSGSDSGSQEAQQQQEPLELEIDGGTNTSWAPSFDYVDQVLLPALEAWFGVAVERRLVSRGWNTGPASQGSVWFRFRPLRPGAALGGSSPVPVAQEEEEEEEGAPQPPSPPDASPQPQPSMGTLQAADGVGVVRTIDVTMVCPAAMGDKLTRALARDLADLFPAADVRFRPREDSGHHSRMFVLLVARNAGAGPPPLLWGRDLLFSPPPRNAPVGRGRGHGDELALSTSELLSRRVCRALRSDVARGGAVDEFLQDQLVIFQALREGRSSFPRRGGEAAEAEAAGLEDAMAGLDVGEERELERDRTGAPFGEGSLHATTARWVAAELLPQARWFGGGRVCQGAGVRVQG
ncbi:hypothetical protein RB595_010268 [Gaeumannomyces hyphopodioides]